MPVDFLSDGEAARYGQYCGPPSQVEMGKVFFLDDADKKLIKACRGPHNRLGYGLLLKLFEQEGRFPRHAGEVPKAAVNYMAGGR
ncbi:DUF4158 domain-containing protein [Streptosporangium sp. G11]|uniref:DUF4158 domain-containing protein n=1 Tax=Streptosporangium sp. G11 TaxID=3436926 RepID=UPI003EBD8AFD